MSFEFFPPKSAETEAKLWDVVNELSVIGPDFVSITYGAGGSTRDRTHKCVKHIVTKTDLKPAAHLTCVAASKSEVDEVIEDYAHAGVKHIVALRGDMPDMAAFSPHPDGYSGSVELVESLAKRGGFDITVSAYPEKHPESDNMQTDIDLLKAKIDAGATRAITQFVFDTEKYYRFRDLLVDNQINIPVIPGIMPTTNFKGVLRMSEACGASVPEWMKNKFDGLDEDLESRRALAIEIATDQCRDLIKSGFENLHFYTLNQATVTKAVCNALSLEKVGGHS
ncbi:methylenetetrahydrofolate reductase [NAD(P)H] [Candidatus Micropelagos thuwalensis]|nr:methylenetetrahydrofolate reductase [NAD(P)H] [Candidatus Micropelagos thuwalensis]